MRGFIGFSSGCCVGVVGFYGEEEFASDGEHGKGIDKEESEGQAGDVLKEAEGEDDVVGLVIEDFIWDLFSKVAFIESSEAVEFGFLDFLEHFV